MEKGEIERLLLRAQGLAVLRGVLASPVAGNLLALLGLLSEERPEPAAVAGTFGRLWEELAAKPEDLLPDAWQSHLTGCLLDEENPFSLGAEKGELAPALVEQVRRDLRALRSLFDLDAETLLGVVEAAVPELGGAWMPWKDTGRGGSVPRRALAEELAGTEDWGDLVEPLAKHHARYGAGLLGRYEAFRWEAGALRPVPRPDPVRLEYLIGYEKEREPLLRNTERLLAGLISPRPPLRLAGYRQVLHRQSSTERVRRQGSSARRARQRRP